MKREEIREFCRSIKYELAKGTHTFTMCECGRHGCRTGRCWECYLDQIYYGKKESSEERKRPKCQP
jgi:hypothetical protein